MSAAINLYVRDRDRKVIEQARDYALENGLSMSELVAAALARYIEGVDPLTLIHQRLEAIEQKLYESQ